jgi:chromosome segregation ATPase
MPSELETGFRIVGALSTVVASIFGWVYFKRYAVERAIERLNKALKEEAASLRRMLSDLQGGIQLEERKLDLALSSKTDCERELREARAELAEWDRRIGDIWVQDS